MRDGDRLDDFVNASFDRLVTGLDRRFGGDISAEDAVQEALVRAWQRSEGTVKRRQPSWAVHARGR